MSKFKYFVGIDVSKHTFDVSFTSNQVVYHKEFEHSKKGVKQMVRWIGLQGVDISRTLFCMEHTGVYSRSLSELFLFFELDHWIEMAYKIKHSMGLIRGKSDRADALVIAQYAERFKDQAILTQISSSSKYQILKDLLAQRERLKEARNAILIPVNELKKMNMIHAKQMLKTIKPALNGIDKSLASTEKLISQWLKENTEDKRQIDFILTVPSVGRITALYIWAATEGMAKCENYKQLACYSGIAPFKNQSGTSVYRKTAVSHMANKKIKKTLYMAALNAIKSKGELAVYYKRKVADGKPKMLVINNLKNKIVARIFAVIKHQQNYKPFNLVLS